MKLHSKRAAMAEINVTPLVDVMLVLLIIFMVTAPLLQQGIDVNLPEAKAKELPQEERMTITVTREGSLYVGKKSMSTRELAKTLRDIAPKNPSVYLKADKDVPYGSVVKIMGLVKSVGIEKLGMITEAPDEDSGTQ